MALERAKRCDDGTMGSPEKKRRRIPLQEVVQELSNVGLTQPALSFVQEVRQIQILKFIRISSGKGQFIGLVLERDRMREMFAV